MIDSGAFENCKQLISFSIPPKITTILSSLVRDCSNLRYFKFPENDQIIELSLAFLQFCSHLQNFSLPTTVIFFRHYCCNDCNLSYLYINESIQIIEAGSFQGNPYLQLSTNILPESLTFIGRYTSVQKIILPETLVYIGKDCFSNCEKLECVYYFGKLIPFQDIYKGIASYWSAFYGTKFERILV